ncbi:MAG: hypothetical protein ACI9QN_001689 [Arcticibacterium sp.]|jgi:hypothetical protein
MFIKTVRDIGQLLCLLCFPLFGMGQLYDVGEPSPRPTRLLMDRGIQIETTAAIDDMYNFNFAAAEREFKWLSAKYPYHPIGYFLIGLSYWWRIVPDTGIERYDDTIQSFMDKSIDLGNDLLKEDETNKEAAFFISAAYAFKGRLYAERENWLKSAWSGKNALKYLELSRGDENINPELLFGDGLYNFYSKWIRENYKSLRPILTFFRKGDKQLGIAQLKNVSLNAFYTRMEARYFLVQIYAMENRNAEARQLATQMHVLYPNNSFFHRYAARTNFVLGKMPEAQRIAHELLANIASEKYGYGPNEGRYGAYILGYIDQNYNKDYKSAICYYEQCVDFSRRNNSLDSGYYLGALLAIGDMARSEKDYLKAAQSYKLIIDSKQKQNISYKKAVEGIKSLKKEIRKNRSKG